MERRSPACKSLVPVPREEARLDPLLGCTIRKIFGGQWYYGQVIAIDADVASGDRAYHIAYEDGDEEHLNAVEVKRFLVQASRSAPPSEPGIGSPRSRRPSMAPRTTPRPSVAPGLARARAPPLGYWGSMFLAALVGALLVACLSSCLRFSLRIMDFRAEDIRAGMVPEMPAAQVPEALQPEMPSEVQLEPIEVSETESVEVVQAAEAPEVEGDAQPAAGNDLALLEEDLSMAAAALAEASGLVVKVVAKNFFRSLEEVWHAILSSFSASLGDAFGEAEEATESPEKVLMEAPVEPETHLKRKEASWLQSLMTATLVLCAIVTVVGNIRQPSAVVQAVSEWGAVQQALSQLQAAPALLQPEMPQAPLAPMAPMPVSHAQLSQAPAPLASPLAPFPSPHAVPMPQLVVEKPTWGDAREAMNTPHKAVDDRCRPEVVATPLKSRSLMSIMGRTPPGTAPVPVTNWGEGERRLPPPPMSLTVGQVPPVAPVAQVAPKKSQETCLRCGSLMASDANFCRHCGQQRGKKVQTKPATPPPARAKSNLVVDKPRFRYGSAMKKLKEMGFDDTMELREILTKCGGDLSATLRNINGMRA